MMGLRPSTAERIRRILDRSPGSEQAYGTGRWKGLRPTFVRCTSATAANTSGVGAQCYPGVIVDLEPTATTQASLADGTVWLTLLGAGGLAKRPVSGAVYECLLSGDVEAATSDTRARAFSVLGAASDSSDCSDVLGLIRADKCLRMTIAGTPTGACADIDTSQTADLTYDDDEAAMISADLLYGVPPGVLTTICDGGMSTGAPNKWNVVVAGFGSPNENFNQSYTITHSTGETWTAVKGGVTVTAVRLLAGWSLTLDDGTYTVTYTTAVAFCCQTIAFDIDDDDGTTTAPATLSMTIATACGNGPSYTPRLERVSGDCGLCLKFTWVPTAGSGSRVVPWKQVGCGEDADGYPYVEFATDDPLICTGEDGTACTGNKVVARLTCVSCLEWGGGGWYCYKGPGVAADCVYLTTAPGEGELWAGPFETAGECDCNSPPDCCPDGFPLEMCVSIGALAGHPELSNQSFEVAYADVIRAGQSTTPALGCTAYGSTTGPGWAYCREYNSAVGGNQWTTIYILPCSGGTFFIQVFGYNGSSEFYAGGIAGGVIGTPPGDCTLPLSATVDTGPVSFGTVDITIGATSDDCGPIEQSWNCIPGTGCVEVFDGSGEYASEAECLTACLSGGGSGGGSSIDCDACGLSGETATIVCGYGTFTAVWSGAAGVYSVTFTDGSFTGSIRVECTTGLPMVLYRYDAGGVLLCTVAATSATCGPPAVFAFSGDCTGGGTCTVTT